MIGDPACGEDMQCVYFGNLEGGLFRCVPVGSRQRGDTCRETSNTSDQCERGLACNGQLCLRAACDRDEDCGLGARCRRFAGGEEVRQCVPQCATDDDCPHDSLCVDPEHTGLRSCYPKRQLGCLTDGTTCRPGAECTVVSPFRWSFRAECRVRCSETNECGANQVCGRAGFCLEACSPSMSCPDTYTCGWDVEAGTTRAVRACLAGT